MFWRKKNKKGLTLVEILFATFILVVGICASLLYFTKAILVTKTARDITTATTHAEYILEEMKTKTTIAEIKNEDWQTWATAQGLNTLTSETVAVSYSDIAADLVNITLQLNWVTKGRPQQVSFVTEIKR